MRLKKIFTPILLLLLTLILVACTNSGSSVEAKKEGDVLVIRIWNNEFQERFRSFYPGYVKTNSDGTDLLDDGTIVKWIQVSNDGNQYQVALDTALAQQGSAAADDKIDIFLIEADYATKYANDRYALDIHEDLKIKKSALADQYQYTKDIVTDEKGVLRATSWQATPGLFAYRQDIAEKLWGAGVTPEQVQEKLKNWAEFDKVATDMKNNGYKMLSGYDDAYRTYSNNFSGKWVDINNNVVIDQKVLDWAKQTKKYKDSGYSNGTSLWDDGWKKDQGPEGDVFGFFYSTWGINFTLLGNSLADANAKQELGNGLFGKYRVVKGPESYYWGGTWIVGAKGTDNPTLVKDIMLKLTANPKIMKDITLKTEDYTNNKTAMNEIANDPNYGSAFLGGQNHIALFTQSADAIDMKNASPYDQGLNEKIQTALKDYFSGTATWQAAWANFVKLVNEIYPELKVPENIAEPK
ncbi:Carbohydrate ABC transporter substrate-binding protein [Alteracholeplasma palmae J233]|uniref:Carbohydrate ABC transporter substrate-binding protein n=1 Tax=Alteracholeplasma palmae (strain ATCC 49389 / J233) TaxID=1318466 RepID=U4KL77_ALTPJ|nr:ABC transporter substrate-binding protein [Alteracholeplasma palmae]CCV64532.1 Carbohydrate ABC transporter substrate-binding protein [Alteracholeplasma palmae J233]